MIVTATCKNCKTNWKVEGAEAFEDVDHEAIEVMLVIEQLSVGKNSAGARTMKLEGLEEPASEWSVDLVRRKKVEDGS